MPHLLGSLVSPPSVTQNPLHRALQELEALMEQERLELQQREMNEMMEAMRIAEAQRAAELQIQHTMKALEAQKLAFEEQAVQKRRAVEQMRNERTQRLHQLQREVDVTRTTGRGSRPPTAPYALPSSAPSGWTGGLGPIRPDLEPLVWSGRSLAPVPEAVAAVQLQAGSAPPSAAPWALPPRAAGGPRPPVATAWGGDPYSSGGSPYSQGGNPYSQGGDPYSQGGDPYSPGGRDVYSDMGPGGPLQLQEGGEDDEVGREYATAKRAMQEEYERERERMLAELQGLAETQLPSQGSSSGEARTARKM